MATLLKINPFFLFEKENELFSDKTTFYVLEEHIILETYSK